ncbi:hypothetical protein ACFYO1_26755 [Nocardia sp. NPDC006044]|uniref:hypothetical protein n=1 Tax=Nocardia sp. NPDC006044 TaxID=3364306 RepID=UPI003682E560
MLIARSSVECQLYMDLHACSCGETKFEAEHVLREDQEGRLLAVYGGSCARCGLPRQFTFELDEAIPPSPPAFGGPTASRIICPGEFLLVAEQAAASVALVPVAGAAPDQDVRDRLAVATAVEAVTEVLKFIPDSMDAVPEDAFISTAGRAAYTREPGRFTRARLEAAASAYREALSARL